MLQGQVCFIYNHIKAIKRLLYKVAALLPQHVQSDLRLSTFLSFSYFWNAVGRTLSRDTKHSLKKQFFLACVKPDSQFSRVFWLASLVGYPGPRSFSLDVLELRTNTRYVKTQNLKNLQLVRYVQRGQRSSRVLLCLTKLHSCVLLCLRPYLLDRQCSELVSTWVQVSYEQFFNS